MRFTATSLLPATLTTGLAVLVLTSQLFAQAPDSGPAAVASEGSGATSQPQSSLASKGDPGQQNAVELSKVEPNDPAAPPVSDPPAPAAGDISGTVSDVNGDLIPGATVVLDGLGRADHRSILADDNGAFTFDHLKPGIPYRITISAKGFVDWKSSAITLNPGQFEFLKECTLAIAGEESSVTVYSSPVQIATEQVHIEEQQRVLGFIPNFYVSYDPNPAPLTTKLKFQLAMRVSVDPITWAGVLFYSGIEQASDTPNYQQGAKGYGQRVGAVSADAFADILIGGAILPSLLHQDPRYFYQGTGTNKSRALHALSFPFICKGDNGRWQPNYSSLGGDLATAALSNAYYPDSNRGVGLVFGNFAIGTAERMASSLAQEFILRRLTPKAKNQN